MKCRKYTYDRLNGRTDETKSRIVWCEDCEYCFYQKLTNTYWCRLCSGIDGGFGAVGWMYTGKEEE